jgi:uncharacterized protein YjbI with pentapeptide repeats
VSGTGFGGYHSAKGEWQREKTLWDWLDLLLVPLILAIGATLFTWVTNRRERKAEDRRVKEQREIEADRARETALQAYLDRMTEMIAEQLRASEPNDAERSIARARTLTMLRQLDGERKGLLLRFLYESGLIGGFADQPIFVEYPVVVGLSGADLTKAQLATAFLSEANLANVDLTEANLKGVNLRGADLRSADLSKANLSSAVLDGANLNGAILDDANLSFASLRGSNLRETEFGGAIMRYADLCSADLRGARLGLADLWGASVNEAIIDVPLRLGSKWSLAYRIVHEDKKHRNLAGEDLSGTDLRGAHLQSATLVGTNLSGADLSGADLRDADLSEADLSLANLSEAIVTEEQIHQASSFDGVTWPDGYVKL